MVQWGYLWSSGIAAGDLHRLRDRMRHAAQVRRAIRRPVDALRVDIAFPTTVPVLVVDGVEGEPGLPAVGRYEPAIARRGEDAGGGIALEDGRWRLGPRGWVQQIGADL